ncbi:hypothetical protein M4D51_13010 [Microbacterium sp. p3-SID338]|uniref:restriction endonuclease subunit S n=1 Tax=Microbacterium sp. p3-SID338 TaxID=2916214 RepID=UPI0021A61863|nr:hypothetical protein [Microbacterium sp. p3-SID338]MCT1396644.1 hypothetical protein [Microbacterium sp. p3-SID338]
MATQHIDPIKVDPAKLYANLGVQWYARGSFKRDQKRGADIKATRLFKVRQGQFVYNRMFVTEGSFAIIAPDHADGVVSNEFPVFDLDQSVVIPEYLLLHFQQPAVWSEIASQAAGTTKSRRRWKESQFLDYRLALPPIAAQRRIVGLTDSLDAAIETANSETAAASELLSQTRIALIQRLENQVAFGDMLARVRVPVDVDPSAPYQEVGLRSHGRGTFVKSAVTGADLGKKKVFWLTPGDLAFNIVFAWEGAVALLGDDVSGKIASHRFPTYRGSNDWIAKYAAEYFKTAVGVQALADFSPGGAGRNKTLNLARLESHVIPVPTQDEGPAIVSALEDLTTTVDAARTHAEALRTLRSNLLTVLLSGEHEIPSSYDQFLNLDEEAAA